jgi:hypothetical protein
MKPEVIVKQQYLIDATGDMDYAVPEILLLGNREGLRELGQWLLDLAEKEPNPEHSEWDPDDHQHAPTRFAPFNPALSDELEFRVGILSEANRDRVLHKYGISESTRQSGDLAARYRRQADAVSARTGHQRGSQGTRRKPPL